MLPPDALIDADFFREVFTAYVGEYAEHRGLRRNPVDLLVVVSFANGAEMPVISWRAGPGWIVLFNEDDEMHTVPYEVITKVTVAPRPEPLPAPPPPMPLGFTSVASEVAG
jgi:hypothetical protein